ncbi:PfkB family carbohydrate kinase [Parafilimonas terrae]|uniref:2-dehydro-3-deoxygluconokinase n=1 Tax=Parafilimonas terrae TaxID=1465490 RepID=A0A1I5XKR7_9BACT|nr:PfkB family carbohydrate kinase [Parafilimonas terrae]SFQ32406.1 2-dehydro-3-deoxygluconokinase [Parafilimonas terrae]
MILSFGEILLRMSPDENGEWINKNTLPVYAGGSELNVAMALAKWKIPVSYCTALPGDFLSKQLIHYIASQKIDVSTIIQNAGKPAFYYLKEGKDKYNEDVVYDRLHSSFYNMQPGMIDWDKTLQGVRWFHFSAVLSLLNKQVATVCEEALKACEKKSITVSIDLNGNAEAWQHDKNAGGIIQPLLKYCDIVAGNIHNVEAMLHIPVAANVHSISTKDNYLLQAKNASEKIMQNFPRCKVVAHPFMLKKDKLEYFATIFGNNNFYNSATYSTDNIIDKSGTGDSFMAGIIYGVYNHLPLQQLINFAAGAAFQKLFIKGEAMNKTVDEIKNFIRDYH